MEPFTAPPPGWFVDPWDSSRWRYWDRVVWTGYTSARSRREVAGVKPAGWFADPYADQWDPGLLGYWDGTTWTGHTSGIGHPGASLAKPRVERRWIQAMVGLVVAEALTVVWGWVRLMIPEGVPPQNLVECGPEYLEALEDFALHAALLPWAVLVLLALSGLVTFILGGLRRSGAGHDFMLFAMVLGWVAVILLNPVAAIVLTEVGSCSR